MHGHARRVRRTGGVVAVRLAAVACTAARTASLVVKLELGSDADRSFVRSMFDDGPAWRAAVGLCRLAS